MNSPFRSIIVAMVATLTAVGLLTESAAAQPRLPGGPAIGAGIRPATGPGIQSNILGRGGYPHSGWNGSWPHSYSWYARNYPNIYSNCGYYPYAGYGYSGYGYGYSGNAESVYAAREQQYQAALFLQALQYRAALLQMQAALRDQAKQQGVRPAEEAAQQPPIKAKPQVPVKAISKPRPVEHKVVLSQEDRASAKLNMAKQFAEDGQVADAADYYREIVEKYPSTSAAHTAQESLDRLVQRKECNTRKAAGARQPGL